MSDPYPSGSSPKGEAACAAMSFAGNAQWSMVNSPWSQFIGCARSASCRRFRYFTIHHVTLAFIAPVAFLNSRPPAIPAIQHSPLTISHFNALSCRFRPAIFFPLRQSFPSAVLPQPSSHSQCPLDFDEGRLCHRTVFTASEPAGHSYDL